MGNKRSQFGRQLLRLVAFFGIILVGGTAYASGNDLDLTKLLAISNGNATPDDAAFKALVRAYGSAFAPLPMNPASTIGQEGFELGVSTKLSFTMDKDGDFWRATERNNNKAAGDVKGPDILSTIQVSLRKGLPFSLEVEGDVNWLADSQMFYLGAGLRWAITEGWWFLPDLSVRAHVGTVVGASQLWMMNLNIDATLSYSWGLGGICNIAPYAGYSMLGTFASSRALVYYHDSESGQITFGRKYQFLSRGFVGVQLKGEMFIFDVAGEFGEDVMSVGVKIGALF